MKEKNKNRTEEEKEFQKNKAHMNYLAKKQKEKEANEVDQILFAMKKSRQEMLQFRRFCCSVCHRMFRRKGVANLTKTLKQTPFENDSDLAHKCLFHKPKIYKDIGETICHTCLRNMRAGKLPRFAIANGLELKALPEELSNLCALERQLIAQVIAFS